MGNNATLCKCISRFFILLFAGWLAFVAIPTAAEEETLIVSATDSESKEDVLVGQLQDWLSELGYYHGERTMVYDANTEYAVYLFCKANGLHYSENGVTQEIWNRLKNGNTVSAQKTEAYEDIIFGESGDSVLDMQMRLKMLGYFDDDTLMLNPSVFDRDTLTALTNFCEINHITNDGSKATGALQKILFSDGAVSYQKKSSFGEKLRGYFSSDVPMAGASVPMLFIWLISGLLLFLIVFLIVWFLVPNRDKELVKKPLTEQETPRLWRKTFTGSNAAGIAAMERLAGEGLSLHFRIVYRGNIQNVTLVCHDVLSIGRAADAQLMLSADDASVSRNHCELYFRGALPVLADHSSNGTVVNGKLLHNAECRIRSGDTITVGHHEILITF